MVSFESDIQTVYPVTFQVYFYFYFFLDTGNKSIKLGKCFIWAAFSVIDPDTEGKHFHCTALEPSSICIFMILI